MSGSQSRPVPAAGGQPAGASGAHAAPGSDPSMEDILASIRRILSEDEPQPAAVSTDPAPSAADNEVLVLDASMEVADLPAEESPAAREEPSPAADSQTVAEPAAQPATAAAPAAEPLPADLIAPEIAAAAASAVSNLMRTLAAERTTRVHAAGPTIEDLVREELRPLLKQWLDRHLPDLVERLVRAEIERVVRRAVP
jgi:cell pole-organizing protein PopZ